MGYYWHRYNKYKAGSMYYVFERKNGTMYCRWSHEGLYDLETVKDVGGEWYGPLTLPEGDVLP